MATKLHYGSSTACPSETVRPPPTHRRASLQAPMGMGHPKAHRPNATQTSSSAAFAKRRDAKLFLEERISQGAASRPKPASA